MKTNQPYDFDKHLTNARHHNYRLHYDKENVNDIVPLVKHGEYLHKIAIDLLDKLDTDGSIPALQHYQQDI